MAGFGAAQSQCRIDVNQDCKVGLCANHQRVQGVHRLAQVTTAKALIHTGRVGKPVTQHDLTSRKCGQNGAFKMIASCGGKQQKFSFSRPSVRITLQHQRTDFFCPRRAPRFARQQNLMALGS